MVEYSRLDNDDPAVIYPQGAFSMNKDFLFNVSVVPQPGLDNRSPYALGGRVVGGGSAVNGMFIDRGSAEDYDNWAKLGNPGWDFAGLLPYFKKVH